MHGVQRDRVLVVMSGGTGYVPDNLEEATNNEGDAEIGFVADEEEDVVRCNEDEEEGEDYAARYGGGVVP